MPFKRVKETEFTNPVISIYAITDHHVERTAIIKASHATVDETTGKKYIKAGLCVSDGTTIDGRKNLTPIATGTEDFDAVIVNDCEVPYGVDEVNVSVALHGFLASYALTAADGSAATKSKNPMLLVIR